MPDNTTLNAGADGDDIASDLISDAGVADGAKVQRVKAGFGANDAYADPTGGEGVIGPGTARVTIATDQAALDVSGATVIVDGSGSTQPVSGTVTADAGTGPWPVTDNSGSLTVDAPIGTPVNVQLGDGTTAAAISTAGEVSTSPQGSAVDANNTSVTPLGIAGVFTGTATDVTQYASMSLHIFADQDSAAAGLSMEFSSDGTNWDVKDQHDVSANLGEEFILPRTSQFFRVVYTNGGTGQGAFRLEVILNRWPVSGEIEELDVDIDSKDLALTTRSIIAGETPGGSFANVKVSTAGNFKVDVEDLGGVAIDLGTGTIDTGTQRVVLATDQPAVTVDGSGVTQPVSGTVTVTHPQLGAGTESGAQRVTLANDSTGLVSVDDGGGNLSIDMGGTVPSLATGVRDAGTQRVTVATDDVVPVSSASALDCSGATVTTTPAVVGGGTEAAAQRVTIASDSTGVVTVDGTVTASNATGNIAHDAADSGNPVKTGAKAIAHGTNPTEVVGADRTDLYANVAGVPFMIGGHPNTQTITARVIDSDGAQANTAIVSTTEVIVVTRVSITADVANTGGVACLVGFGASTIGTPGTGGLAGMLADHQGIPAGGGMTVGDGSGIIGVGAVGDDIRYTCEDPAGGGISISITYYTIAT
jgi:hypothetical protein